MDPAKRLPEEILCLLFYIFFTFLLQKKKEIVCEDVKANQIMYYLCNNYDGTGSRSVGLYWGSKEMDGIAHDLNTYI